MGGVDGHAHRYRGPLLPRPRVVGEGLPGRGGGGPVHGMQLVHVVLRVDPVLVGEVDGGEARHVAGGDVHVRPHLGVVVHLVPAQEDVVDGGVAVVGAVVLEAQVDLVLAVHGGKVVRLVAEGVGRVGVQHRPVGVGLGVGVQHLQVLVAVLVVVLHVEAEREVLEGGGVGGTAGVQQLGVVEAHAPVAPGRHQVVGAPTSLVAGVLHRPRVGVHGVA